MFIRNLGVIAVGAIAGVLAVSGPASAQTGNPFSCSAATASVASGGSTLLAPTTANPALTPCASDTAAIGNVTVPAGGGAGSVTVGPVDAQTTLSTARLNGSTVYTGANATSTVRAATVTVDGHTISIGPAVASVDDSCVDNAAWVSAGSTLNSITIDGTTTTLSGQPQTFSLDGLVTIAVNQQTTSGTNTTETLLEVSALNGGTLTGGGQVIVGTATAGGISGACAGTAGATGGSGSGTPGSGSGGSGTGGAGSGGGGAGASASGPCPSGAALSYGSCVVVGTSIPVPTTSSQDVVGGSVMSLAAARSKFGAHYSCLNGAGPKYVVVGTKRANKITVRKVRLRVLGLGGNDHITVIGGKRTCVNGGAGNDTIVNTKKKNFVTAFGSNGKDHITLGNGPGFVMGGKGNDTIAAGNGKVNVQGNAGNDHIKVGNGPARVNGGNGNDVLIAGTGKAHLNGGKGRNRITARGKIAYVQANRKGHSVAYVRKHNAKYARRHGVAKVHVIK